MSKTNKRAAVLTAVLIDPVARTLTDVNVDGRDPLRSLYALMGCSLVDFVHVIDERGRRTVIVVDDEGLLKDGQKFFTAAGYPQPLAGKAVVIGLTDRDGDFKSCIFNAEQVSRAIGWASDEEVRLFRDSGFFDTRITSLGADGKPTGPVDVVPVRPTLSDEVLS